MNKSMFGSKSSAPTADVLNDAGGKAYKLGPRESLAQIACTGTLNDTFYASAEDQLTRVLESLEGVYAQGGQQFIAQLAVYSRNRGYMKDMPAVMLAFLAGKSTKDRVAGEMLKVAWPLVIDNGKMVRNFVQAVRSGKFGRRGLGTLPARLIKDFLRGRSPIQLLKDSVGNDPSLVDIIRLGHPRPVNEEQSSAFAFFLGKNPDTVNLHPTYRNLREIRDGKPVRIEKGMPWELLVSENLSPGQWEEIMGLMGWTALRMNLNTLQRHGVFDKDENVERVAARLSDPVEIGKARVFPYQIMTAYQNLGENVPQKIRSALHKALDLSIVNTPSWLGKTLLCVDVSGSMSSPITGHRKGSTTKTRCVDVAALVAGVICKHSPESEVIAFDMKAHPFRYVPEDSVLTNAKRLAAYGGGGTACSVALDHYVKNRKGQWPDQVVYVSDNESWADFGGYGGGGATSTMERFTRDFPQKTRLVLIDLVPNTTTQAPNTRGRVLNVGGFSDQVFSVVSTFLEGKRSWVEEIERTSLTLVQEPRIL